MAGSATETLLGPLKEKQGYSGDYPSGNLYNSLLLKMAIYSGFFCQKHGDVPVRYVNVYQRVFITRAINHAHPFGYSNKI